MTQHPSLTVAIGTRPYHAIVFSQRFILAPVTSTALNFRTFDEAEKWCGEMMLNCRSNKFWQIKSNQRPKLLASGGDEFAIAEKYLLDPTWHPLNC